MFKTNLYDELLLEKEESKKELENILDPIKVILDDSSESDRKLLENAGFTFVSNTAISFKEKYSKTTTLEDNSIFSLDEIRKICIKYHLRFLPINYFKGKIDNTVLEFLRHKNIKAEYYIGWERDCKNLFVAAPASSFKLSKRPLTDPLLFEKLNKNGVEYYKLLHKWGGDISILRKILFWPVRNYIHLNFLAGLPLLILSIYLAFSVGLVEYPVGTSIWIAAIPGIILFSIISTVVLAILDGCLNSVVSSNNWLSKFRR